MKNLASVVVGLLSHITFVSADEQDPDLISDLMRDSWQTLIHHLSPEENQAICEVLQSEVAWLEQRKKRSPLSPAEAEKLTTFAAFLNGELS